MSEKEPSIAYDEGAIASALGANEAIFIGTITMQDSLTGASLRRVAAHKIARVAAASEAEAGNVFGRHFAELARLADTGEDGEGSALTVEQREIAAKGLLLATQARYANPDEEPAEKVVERLSVWYWLNQDAAQSTRLVPILRQLPEDYGIDQNVPLHRRGEIFHEAAVFARAVQSGREDAHAE